MMTTHRHLLLLVLPLAGCLGLKSSDPTRFYSLNPAFDAAAGVKHPWLELGIGPVELPAYLKRLQVVSRAGDNQLKVADLHFWAEPLNDNITSVVGETLGAKFGTARVSYHPWRAKEPAHYQLLLQIIRFDGQRDGPVRLRARWTVLGPDRRPLLGPRLFVSDQRPADDGMPARVAAMNRALLGLCDAVARALAPKIDTSLQDSKGAQ